MPATTYVANSKIHGKGLFADGHISAGSVIGWIKGVPTSIDDDYVLWISDRQAVEVTCKLRYINHSDNPNACYYDDLSVIALTNIQPHTEITHNYGSNDW